MSHTRKRSLQYQKNSRLKKRHTRRDTLIFSRAKNIGVGFIIVGIVFFITAYFTPAISSALTRKNNSEPIHPDSKFSVAATGKQPTRVVIPQVGIDVAVTPAPIENGYWKISEDSAAFGLGSSPPGSMGNTVIFAHAREGLFLPLKNIKVKAKIYVFTDIQWYSYEVTTIKEVWPNETYVVSPTKFKQLTLFTCSGFFDTLRLVVTAIPTEK